ncbi:MAG: M48 family metalloprotease [Candidatus Eremiobacteraeota bacterium]|nr:M48 family metalloprotease [Candidatus Eremiobacteraeota bacterium]
MINLAFRSFLVLALLFGILFGIGMGIFTYLDVAPVFAFIFAVVIIFLQYLLGPYILDWIYRIRWKTPDTMPEHLREFITAVMAEHNIPFPRFGIIDDGNPNAFTYGHYPGNARLVITRGLMEILNEDELHSVIGHEIGHIKHWDFVIMTVAAIVPLLLYILARTLLYTRGGGRSRGAAVLIGVISFIAYMVSQYIVLFLSRIREYYADQFSGRLTGDPNLLSSSLVKIAYGLARAPEDREKKDETLAIAGRSFGIFDPKSAGALALNSSLSGGFSTENMEAAMKWDMWNPWAIFMEMSSSHPLPAKRIMALEKQAKIQGKQPLYGFIEERRPESYWDEFLVDLFFKYLPLLGFISGLVFSLTSHKYFGISLVFLGITYWIKLAFAYPRKNFPGANITDLLARVKVSGIRSFPVTLNGEVIGRGIPGLMWSKDLVLQDETGFIPVIYRQPLGILELIFGLFKAPELIGEEITVSGWYRRTLNPYLEIKEVIKKSGERIKCHFLSFQLFLAGLSTAIGILWLILEIGGH